MSVFLTLPSDYWKSLSMGKQDIDFLNSYLFEHETPLTVMELVPILVEMRIQTECQTLVEKHQKGSKVFSPKERFKTGEKLVFPSLGWRKGQVTGVRAGFNPQAGDFDVISVEFEDGAGCEFAANLPEHKLNQPMEVAADDQLLNPVNVLKTYRHSLEGRLNAALEKSDDLVQVAGRWFPRALLVDVNVGHLNLAEAVLDEAAGQSIATSSLLEQIGLAENVNPKLLEFSLSYALQEDGRFDDVGPTGEVLWCLQRLEPQDVREIPAPLQYIRIEYDRSVLTSEMLALEAGLDDELSEVEPPDNEVDEITLSLTYPHWRAGTLPISARMRGLFPTAYYSPRVRFMVVDGESGEEIPGWVVRLHGYVAGLGALYKKYGLMPGSLVTVQRSKEAGKMLVRPRLRRPMRDWVRTVLVGRDGGIVFALLKQNVNADYDERMAIHVPDVEGVDQARALMSKEHMPFAQIVADMMRELIKMNVQGHVHALELYSALNIVRRCPPGAMLAFLSMNKDYVHVGDLHYRLNGSLEEAE